MRLYENGITFRGDFMDQYHNSNTLGTSAKSLSEPIQKNFLRLIVVTFVYLMLSCDSVVNILFVNAKKALLYETALQRKKLQLFEQRLTMRLWFTTDDNA